MTTSNNYYEALGLKNGASPDEIKKAYRRLARKHHPDVNPGDKGAEERFKKIGEAYDVLGDPKKKDQYDRFGSAAFSGGGQDYGGARGFHQEDMHSFEGGAFDFGFGDIFGDFQSQGRRPAGPKRGRDMSSSMDITLDEAYKGVTRGVSLRRESPCSSCSGTGVLESTPCPACGGSGHVKMSKGFFNMSQPCGSCGGAGKMVTKACTSCKGAGSSMKTENLNIKIPPGVDTGSSVRLRGMGNAGEAGGKPGDLLIKLTVKPHRLFKRTGNDISLELPVTFSEAALGAKVQVPTLDGSTVMTLPPGTQGGQRFKLKGKGFTQPGKSIRGSMYVDVRIAVPKKLDKAAKDAMQKIASSYKEDPRKGLG